MFSTPNPKEELLGGGFLLGVNYWPCEYGVSMWKKWAPSVIDSVFDARIEPSRLIMPLKTGNAYSVNFGHIPEMNYWTVTKIHGKVE
jgi:hypothetical protein